MPAALGIVTDLPATAASGVAFSQQPKVRLTDAAGSPFAQRGVLVTATLGSGAGTVVGTSSARTGDDGIAAFTDLGIAGTPGRRTLRFSATGLASVESGAVDLAAGPAALLAIKAGGHQSSPAGTPVPIRPQVSITDATGNPVAGVAVTFTAAGTSTVDAGTQTTDAAGLATVGNWILGPKPGSYSLTATAVGFANPVTFQATATIGPPAVMTVFAGDNQSAVAGTAVTTAPAVRVADIAGNPIRGVTVVFAALGDGSVTAATATTDTSGVATVGSWVLTADPGPNTLTVSRTGLPPVSVHATATPVPLVVVGGAAQLGASGAELFVPVTIRATRAGLPQQGVTVRFTVTDGGGHFDSLAVQSDLLGIATSRWTLGTGLGIQHATVSADLKGPVSITATAVGFKRITAGRNHACGLLTTGEAYCWGDNNFGQLGDSSFVGRLRPVRVVGGLVFDSLEAAGNGNFTCGLTHDGAMWCWGSNRHGQLGDGTTTGTGGPFGTERPFPTLVSGGFTFRNLSLGGDHACATTTTDQSYCWGRNFSGEIGDGSSGNDKLLPTLVQVPSGVTFATIVTGNQHSCGLVPAAVVRAYCWGANQNLQLGTGLGTPTIPTPTAVAGGLAFNGLTAGANGTCGLVGVLAYCWGQGGQGQIGDNASTSRATPTQTSGGNPFVELSGKGDTYCGILKAGGTVLCWGANGSGQAGTGSAGNVAAPSPVGTGLAAAQVSLAASTSCMIAAINRAAYCWGPNTNGQVGDGTRIQSPVPTLVRF